MFLFNSKKKLERLLQKGEKAVLKNNPKKALRFFKKALKIEKDNPDIYSKLIECREKIDDEWDQKDFIEFMEWSLAEQGHSSPAIKQVYARLSPEWKETWEIAMSLFKAEDNEITEKTELLVKKGEVAVRVLADIITQLSRYKENGGDVQK